MKRIALTLLIATGALMVACGGGSNSDSGKSTMKSNEDLTSIPEPNFVKEGELSFLNKEGKEIKKIDVEIADDDQQRQQGLMYRKSMADTQGMLFKFDKSEPQSFWMHNTYISLDIIYVNEHKEIVKICKNAAPLNENQNLNSEKNAQYVIEVIGGFSDKFGVAEGDKVAF